MRLTGGFSPSRNDGLNPNIRRCSRLAQLNAAYLKKRSAPIRCRKRLFQW